MYTKRRWLISSPKNLPPILDDEAQSQNVGIEDMITLRNLTEESIMENLRERYIQRLVYVKLRNIAALSVKPLCINYSFISQTYTGTILVAMNPFARLKIYDNVRA